MKALSKTTVAVLLTTVVLLSALPAPAQTSAPASLPAKRQAQERARTMARELVSSVLDMQLTKLEVNGLDKLPIHGEIALMRKNIDRLIDTDMAEVAELLSQAQNLPAAERQKKYAAIREKTRGIVVRLSIERQNLLRRLKLADMAAQIRRLIDLQSTNLRQTETLAANQSAQTLATIQDERDLKALYGQLHNLVRAVSTWGGAEGSAAADGLRILKAARVGEEIDAAIASLEAVKFADAAVREKAVVKGLSALLEKIDEARGLASSDIEGLLKEVAQLTKWQQDLKQKTKVENLSDKAAEELLQQQSKLHKDLDKFDEALKRIPGAEAPLQKAKASAYEATADLFAAKQSEAIKEQDKVLANLATITEQLKKAANQENTAKSADQLARLSEHLKKARAALQESEPHQRKAFAKEPAKAETVKENLEQLGKKLEQARGEPELPSQVAARLDEAKDAVKRAREKGESLEKRNEAKAAVERATAEVNAAAAEAERRQLAVKIGELGRAAEALERAAAHQRDLSDKAAKAAKKDGFTPAEATELHKEQQEVAKVAENTAEGVKNTAPKAAEKLAKSKPPIRKAETELGKAKQTAQAADTVAKEAKKAEKVLQATAAQLRSEIKDTAKALVRVAADQLAELGEVSKEVDRARADLPSADKDQMEELAKAKKRIAEARTEQQRALGQEKAAKQRDRTRKIAEALEQQDRADQAAKDLTDGKTARTVDAAVVQQTAADQVGEVAKETKDATGEALAKAEKASTKAAKDLLDGRPHQAEAARKEARAALVKALQDARAQAEKTANEEEGKPNADAQKRVGDLAREAAQLAKDDAPAAVEHLDKAGEHSKDAEKKLASGDKPRHAQKNADAALRDAERQIDKAMKDLAQRQLDQKEGKGEQIAQAADKSAKVDPDALAALREAEKNAKTKENAAPQSDPSEMPQTPKSVKETRNNLDKAADALDNRKAQAERDKALAEEVGRDAAQQQQARDRIDADAKELTKSDDEGKSDNKDAKAQEMKAANDLANAMNEFAGTQRRIGENAREISKQEDVANQPLVKALEAASKLAKPEDGEPRNGEPRNGEPRNGEPKNGELGTGLVPSSSEQTARSIAGARAAVKANQGQPQNGNQPGAQANQPGNAPAPPSANSGVKGSMNPTQRATQGKKSGAPSGSRGADSTAKAAASREEPWMAKLPPEMRKAIGANARQRPPRGYEELLRRYFQREE